MTATQIQPLHWRHTALRAEAIHVIAKWNAWRHDDTPEHLQALRATRWTALGRAAA